MGDSMPDALKWAVLPRSTASFRAELHRYSFRSVQGKLR